VASAEDGRIEAPSGVGCMVRGVPSPYVPYPSKYAKMRFGRGSVDAI